MLLSTRCAFNLQRYNISQTLFLYLERRKGQKDRGWIGNTDNGVFWPLDQYFADVCRGSYLLERNGRYYRFIADDETARRRIGNNNFYKGQQNYDCKELGLTLRNCSNQADRYHTATGWTLVPTAHKWDNVFYTADYTQKYDPYNSRYWPVVMDENCWLYNQNSNRYENVAKKDPFTQVVYNNTGTGYYAVVTGTDKKKYLKWMNPFSKYIELPPPPGYGEQELYDSIGVPYWQDTSDENSYITITRNYLADGTWEPLCLSPYPGNIDAALGVTGFYSFWYKDEVIYWGDSVDSATYFRCGQSLENYTDLVFELVKDKNDKREFKRSRIVVEFKGSSYNIDSIIGRSSYKETFYIAGTGVVL